jgi:hypothetical protein
VTVSLTVTEQVTYEFETEDRNTSPADVRNYCNAVAVVLRGDRGSQLRSRTATAPRAMAILCNLAIGTRAWSAATTSPPECIDTPATPPGR